MTRNYLLLTVLILGIIGTSLAGFSQDDDFSLLLKGGKIVSPPGLFAPGKGDMKEELADFLDSLGDFLKRHPGLIVEIGGHADDSGSDDINRKLSLARALGVKDFLVEKKLIRPDRLLTRGYAHRFPISDNRTLPGKTKNRRVEIIVVQDTDPSGRLTYILRQVLTRPGESSEFIPATLNQGLFYLDRVLTREKSNANITFQDLSRIDLGPQSLMVMYSLFERMSPIPNKQNVKLLTGGLRTKLNQLKGGLQVETPACLINSDSVEIIIGIDDKKMSSLSVFDGKSEVKAQGKSVEVPEGYGTVVETGAPPAPPEPLPPAPQLIAPLAAKFHSPDKSGTLPVPFQWQPVEEAYHLQVATDAGFEKIVEDQVIRGPGANLQLPIGNYHWRLAAISQKGIEGFPAQSAFNIDALAPELPISVDQVPEIIPETLSGSISIHGKTVAGAQVSIRGQACPVDNNGAFSASTHLERGLNHIIIKGTHAQFRPNTFRLIAYRPFWYESLFNIGFRFAPGFFNDHFRNIFSVQLGKTIGITPRLAAEFSLGISNLHWKISPKNYHGDFLALPLTAELHLALARGGIIPYLSGGLTAYLAVPERSNGDQGDLEYFLSPAFGLGLSFFNLRTPVRLEIKYSPLLEKEPFFTDIVHRISFIFKLGLGGD